MEGGHILFHLSEVARSDLQCEEKKVNKPIQPRFHWSLTCQRLGKTYNSYHLVQHLGGVRRGDIDKSKKEGRW